MGIGVNITFWVAAIITVFAAVSVIAIRDLFHAALLLVLSFLAVAAVYVTLSADFLAMVQILVYVGAIGVLLIFAIMVTRDVRRGNPFNDFKIPALLLCFPLFVAFVVVAVGTDWMDAASASAVVDIGEPTTVGIADALFDKDMGYLLPLEITAALLLAAVIGAIALVREK